MSNLLLHFRRQVEGFTQKQVRGAECREAVTVVITQGIDALTGGMRVFTDLTFERDITRSRQGAACVFKVEVVLSFVRTCALLPRRRESPRRIRPVNLEIPSTIPITRRVSDRLSPVGCRILREALTFEVITRPVVEEFTVGDCS